MQKLIILCGVSKSGKTLAAHELSKEHDAKVFSYREYEQVLKERNQIRGKDSVYKKIFADMKKAIKSGKNVIYDSFNLTRRNRQRVLAEFSKINVEKIVYIMTTPLRECYKRNEMGFEKEEEIEIFKTSTDFEIPMEFEGFDKIFFYDHKNDQFPPQPNEEKINRLFDKTRFFIYRNRASSTLYNHLLECYDRLGVMADRNLKIAGLYHDIGKLFCETHDEENFTHYYGHANCGAYYLISHLDSIFNYGDPYTWDDIREIAFYINYHTKIKQLKTPNSKEKYKRLFGDKLFTRITHLTAADEESYGDKF